MLLKLFSLLHLVISCPTRGYANNTALLIDLISTFLIVHILKNAVKGNTWPLETQTDMEKHRKTGKKPQKSRYAVDRSLTTENKQLSSSPWLDRDFYSPWLRKALQITTCGPTTIVLQMFFRRSNVHLQIWSKPPFHSRPIKLKSSSIDVNWFTHSLLELVSLHSELECILQKPGLYGVPAFSEVSTNAKREST